MVKPIRRGPSSRAAATQVNIAAASPKVAPVGTTFIAMGPAASMSWVILDSAAGSTMLTKSCWLSSTGAPSASNVLEASVIPFEVDNVRARFQSSPVDGDAFRLRPYELPTVGRMSKGEQASQSLSPRRLHGIDYRVDPNTGIEQ